MKINIQKFARVYLSRFVALVCAVVVLFASIPSASAIGEEIVGAVSLNNGSWSYMSYAGDDLDTRLYSDVYGTLQFNVRYSWKGSAGLYDYDFYDFTVQAFVASIDSISAYSNISETALPVEVSWINGNPHVDSTTDDLSSGPRNFVFTVRVDCSTLPANEVPYLRIFGSFLGTNYEPGEQNICLWGMTGSYASDVSTPETSWLEKIWNSVTSGFTSVGNFLTNIFDSMVSGFDRVIELLDEFVNGSEEDREQIEQSKGEMESAGNDLTNAGNALDALDRPEVQLDTFVPTELTGAMYLAYVNCVQIFWNEPTLLAMVTILASIILLSYLLHGEKG